MAFTSDVQVPRDLLDRYRVSPEIAERLSTYVHLLLTWQKRINLIGPDTVATVWQRHIADSLHVANLVDQYCGDTASFMDFGTGAGLPGIPAAIQSGRFVHLVESNGKKAAFLREALRITNTPGIVHACRIEDIDSETLQPAPDIITARALAPLEKLISYASPWLAQSCIGLFMKGQHVDKELTEATKYWKMDIEKLPADPGSDGVVLKITNIQAKSEI